MSELKRYEPYHAGYRADMTESPIGDFIKHSAHEALMYAAKRYITNMEANMGRLTTDNATLHGQLAAAKALLETVYTHLPCGGHVRLMSRIGAFLNPPQQKGTDNE